MHYRAFDIHEEDPGKIWRLHSGVYGNAKELEKRWEWEFLNYPGVEQPRVFVAELEGDTVGATVRMPVKLKVGDRVTSAGFATNSLVSPKHRGKGIIRKLYAMAAEDGRLQLSKGTTPAMYRQLLEMGYHSITPNTYMVSLLSPLRWGLWRMTGIKPWNRNQENALLTFSDYTAATAFDNDNVVCDNRVDSLEKSLEYLNWRYFHIPFQHYEVYVRRVSGKCVSWCVLAVSGMTAFLMDLDWEKEAEGEPGRTVRFAKTLARQHGAIKLVYWGTSRSLRAVLKKEGFWDRRETPHFSFFSRDPFWLDYSWGDAHFVHGDGDNGYL